MDALELIRADHARVISLLEQFKAENARQQQALLFQNIRDDLHAHLHMEETAFYPAFKNYPDFNEIIEASYDEHQAVKSLLTEIVALPAGDPLVKTRVEALGELVGSHMREEEEELFPMIRKLMKRSEREQLGRHLDAAKLEFQRQAA